jgi:anti-sigma regulatory factor (Ser/Thr protein kinase)
MELVLTLPADVLAPRVARRALGSVGEYLPKASEDDVELLVSELVTNAVRHGGLDPSDEVEVWAECSPQRVRVEVVGGRRPFENALLPSLDQLSGWGLLLVGQLADRWGIGRTRAGTAVWFEIDRGPTEARASPPSGSRQDWVAVKARHGPRRKRPRPPTSVRG